MLLSLVGLLRREEGAAVIGAAVIGAALVCRAAGLAIDVSPQVWPWRRQRCGVAAPFHCAGRADPGRVYCPGSGSGPGPAPDRGDGVGVRRRGHGGVVGCCSGRCAVAVRAHGVGVGVRRRGDQRPAVIAVRAGDVDLHDSPLGRASMIREPRRQPMWTVSRKGVDDAREQEARLRAERARRIALFRYELIQDVIDPTMSTRQCRPIVRALAERDHDGPFGEEVRMARKTIGRWCRWWRAGGFAALVPKPAGDALCRSRHKAPLWTVRLCRFNRRPGAGQGARVSRFSLPIDPEATKLLSRHETLQ
jgi:hypothetical protein